MKQLKYDYAKLDKFLQEDYPEKDYILDGFIDFCSAYASMATLIVNQAGHGRAGLPNVQDDAPAYMHRYLKIFQIIESLPSIQEGGES